MRRITSAVPVDSLLSLAETYQGHAKDGAAQVVQAGKDAHTDGGITAAQDDLKVRNRKLKPLTARKDFTTSRACSPQKFVCLPKMLTIFWLAD